MSQQVNHKKSKEQKNNKNQGRRGRRQQQQQKQKVITPAGQFLRKGGETLGGFFGMPKLGKSIGEGISRIFGQGDYMINNPKSNSLMGGVPAFSPLSSGMRVKHREYIRDISSSTSFSTLNFNLNPGDNTLFPWLSKLASNFEEYKVHGMIVYLNTSSGTAVGSTNTALGIWGVVTQYDASEAPFSTKQECENYVGSQSSVVCQSMAHGIECKPNQNVLDRLYIRTGSVATVDDIKFYDMGNIQIFTQGSQAVSTIGEMWISYDIELFKPKINQEGQAVVARYNLTGVQPTGNNTFGGASIPNPLAGSNLAVTFNAAFVNQCTIPAQAPVGVYIFDFSNSWTGGITMTTPTVPTFTGSISLTNRLLNDTGSTAWYPPAGATGITGSAYTIAVYKNGYTAGTINLSAQYCGANTTTMMNIYYIGDPDAMLQKRSGLTKFRMDELEQLRILLKAHKGLIQKFSEEESKGENIPKREKDRRDKDTQHSLIVRDSSVHSQRKEREKPERRREEKTEIMSYKASEGMDSDDSSY